MGQFKRSFHSLNCITIMCFVATYPQDVVIHTPIKQDKCETFIDEDCKYQGDVLIKPPPGTTSDGVECQEMCQEFKDIGCKYWVFLREEKSCTLYKSGKRKCSTKRGPYRPRFSRCKN